MILIMLSNVEANEKHCKKCYCKIMYSGAQKKVYEYCFMKQKCQLQMGIARYRNEARLLTTKGIDTTHQHFQMRFITLFQLKWLKSHQILNV